MSNTAHTAAKQDDDRAADVAEQRGAERQNGRAEPGVLLWMLLLELFCNS
jgi:hypothetical protein